MRAYTSEHKSTALPKLIKLLLTLFLMLVSNALYAIYPRAYIPAPADTFALVAYYDHADSDGRFSNGNQLNTDLSVSSRLGIIRPVYYFDWLGTRMAINGILYFGEATIRGSSISGGKDTSSGMADPTLNLAAFFINQPEDKLWMGVSEYLTLPFGEYDNTSAINLGENRVKAKTELSLVKGYGSYYVDVSGSVTLYGENNNFSASSGNLEQDALWGFEIQLSRKVSDKTHFGIGGIWQWDGESKLNGSYRNDAQRTNTLQISYSHKFTPKNHLAILYKKDISVENGFKINRLSMRYIYIF